MANNFVEPAQHDTQTCSVHPEEQPGTSAAGLISVSDDPPTSQPSKMNVKRSADQKENICKYHTQMIAELGDLFSRKQWRSICNRVKTRKYVSTKDMDDVESMEDLCITLRKKGVIKYGDYSKLREILVTFDVEAGEIIDDVTSKIHQEMEGPSPARQPRMEEQSTEIASRLRPMIETTKAMILKVDKEYNFFQTKSFQVAKEKLMKNGLVIIKGNSGDGKTSMALELLRLLSCDGVDGQRRQPLELHDIPDFKSVAPKSQLVIYVDDIFGKNVVRERDVDEWEKREESILSKFCGKEHRDGNFLVITVRNGIFNSLKGSLEKIFDKENIVDVNLDEQEKLELLRLYKPKDKFDSWNDKEEKAIIRFAPDLGFPQCCRLFRDTHTLHTGRVLFFKRPFDFLKPSLSKLKDGKFYGLMYLFLKGGFVEEDDLDDLNENIDQNVLEAAFAVDVVKVAPVGEPLYKLPKERKVEFVKDSLDCLLGWLVKKESSYGQKVYYKFNHDSIGETVALLYGEKTPIGFIQNCPKDYLKYITTSQTAPNQIVISSDNKKNAMYKRVFRELESDKNGWFHRRFHSKHKMLSDYPMLGAYIDMYRFDPILSLGVWIDDTFLKGFIRWLTDQHVDKNLCHDIKLALLNKACSSGSEDCALFLLLKGVKPDVDTAYHVVRSGCVRLLKQIFKDISNEIKARLLNVAYSSGSEDCALFLLSEGMKPDEDTAYCVVRGGCVNALKQIFKDISNEIKPRLLNKACSSGSEDCALFLLSQGVKPDEDTAFKAAKKGHMNVLKKIYGYVSNEIKPGLLNEACSSGSEDCALFLLSEGVIPDMETLFSVISGGCVNVLGKLLEDDIYTTARADESQSSLLTCSIYVLHEAIFSERKEMVFMLFDRYPHLVHDTDELGQSLLHLLTRSEDCDLFKNVERMMLSPLCRVEDEQHKCEVVNGRVVHRHCVCAQYICQLVDHRGHTVLHISCYWGNRDVCKYLLESYPALATVVSNNGDTVLHSGCHWGRRHTSEHELKSFSALTAFVINDCRSRDECDHHLELFPVIRNIGTLSNRSYDSQMVKGDDCKYLCELFPALTTDVNYNRETVLHYRCKAGDNDSVKYLCESFLALTAAVSNDGETVLHYSCKAGDNDSVKYLCESFPALTAAVSNDGRHCLHYIAVSRFSNVDMFIECETHVKQYLESTERKYDITTIRDRQGNSVLDLAKKGAPDRREEEFVREHGLFWKKIVGEKAYEDKNDPLYDHINQLFGQ